MRDEKEKDIGIPIKLSFRLTAICSKTRMFLSQNRFKRLNIPLNVLIQEYCRKDTLQQFVQARGEASVEHDAFAKSGNKIMIQGSAGYLQQRGK
jgi:hypothetical protein